MGQVGFVSALIAGAADVDGTEVNGKKLNFSQDEIAQLAKEYKDIWLGCTADGWSRLIGHVLDVARFMGDDPTNPLRPQLRALTDTLREERNFQGENTPQQIYESYVASVRRHQGDV